MNIDVTTEIDISRPRAEVAAFAADLDNATTRYKDIKAARWETPRPLQVGQRIAFEAEFLGRPLAYTYQVPEQTVPASAGKRLPGDRTRTGPLGGVHTSDMPNAANSFGSMTPRCL